MKTLFPAVAAAVLAGAACGDPEAVTTQALSTAPAEQTLIAARSAWQYWSGGLDLGTAWREHDWTPPTPGATGTGPLGFGESYVNPIAYGSKPMTVYFRKAFLVDDPARFTGLRLEVMYDDGFVAYLNGQALTRGSMPAGEVSYATRAFDHEALNRYNSFAASVVGLRAGWNTLAIEVHQTALSSSDLVFDAALFAELGEEPPPPEGGLARGSTWRYWDRGGDLGTAWRAASYDDASWRSGPGPLGYGESYLATTVGFGPSSSSKYITTYFRARFTVDDPGAVTRLTGELMYDDGVVVFLNGQEVGRSYMPAGTVDYTTRSPGHETGNHYERFDWSAHRGLLVAGVNTLAVEVHQASASSSDLTFDAALILEKGTEPPPPVAGVPRRSTWRYWDRGGEGGVVWRGEPYDDSSWASGPAPLGYGESYLATTVARPPAPSLTIYYRTHFTVEDPAAVSALIGELMYDDGAVVYLNGAEIQRASMRDGWVYYNTTALGHETGNAYETFDWWRHRDILVPGVNTLAVEVHQVGPSSSDTTFDLALIVESDPVTVPAGSTWRYQDGAGDLGTAWRAPAYDDASWKQGAAPLGYGESYIVTPVASGRITTWFRKRFAIADPEQVGALVGAVRWDDGAVVYLNGVEIERLSLPAGPITASTLASSHEATAFEARNWTPHIGLLVPGENVLAVEVHQSSVSSSDLVFDLTLDAHVGTIDTDGDRLPDRAETGTGVYLGPDDTGTRLDQADSDGDGLRDGDEVLGTLAGLDLPALGVSPVHKDILLEYDWLEDDLEAAPHSHRPEAVMLDRVTAAFAAAPVDNPDGVTGIHVIHDYGQGGAFTGGNRFDDSDGIVPDLGAEFAAHKAANFSPLRQGYFHYVLMPHSGGTSGWAYIVGDSILFNTGYTPELRTRLQTSSILMHELGHNLGLYHGGRFTSVNHKPNYNSVMNYRYQFGADADCDGRSDPLLAYSLGQNAALDESSLDERVGICGGVPQDWNGSGVIETTPIRADINSDGVFSILRDDPDWPYLVYDFAPAQAAMAPPEVIHCVWPDSP